MAQLTNDNSPTNESKVLLSSSTSNNTSNNASQELDQSPKKCPYKYYVIAACFFNVMFSLGVNRSLIIYLTNFQDTFNLSEKATVLFIVLPMIFGGLAAPIAAMLTKKFSPRLICSLFSLLGTCAWLFGVFLGMGTDKESLDELALSFEGNCTIKGELQADVTHCILKQKFRGFIMCVAIAGWFHGGVLVNAPIEVNRWVLPNERGFWNSIVWMGSSAGAIWIAPTFKYAITAFEGDWIKSLFLLVTLQGFVLLSTSLILIEPKNSDLYDANQMQKCTFKKLWKFKLFKAYLWMQICYGLWRSGFMNMIVKYGEGNKNFSPTNAALVVTIGCVFELCSRPIVGRISDKYSRYAIIGVLFAAQSLLTLSLTSTESYWAFTAVVAAVGAVQGGAGGLFMTAVIDAVGVNFARYAYSMENMIDVFVAGFATQLYAVIGDKFFTKQPVVETIHWMKNDTISIIDTGEVARVDLDYVYYISSGFIALAALMSYRGYVLQKIETSKSIIYQASPESSSA